MLAVVKRCGKAAEIAHISGELGELQDIVGGLIEPWPSMRIRISSATMRERSSACP